MRREHRLVFGEVAELYDRHRPAYPDAVVEDLVALAGLQAGSLVLEVGAGTGKATAMFAARGIRVLAVEPSAEMAAVARRVCAAYEGVRVEQSDFERWDPAGRQFPLLFAAQAWHWVQPDVGFAKAAWVLRPGGVLAALWNRPVWARAPLREAVLDAYQRVAPELLAETDPIHPGGSPPSDAWSGEPQSPRRTAWTMPRRETTSGPRRTPPPATRRCSRRIPRCECSIRAGAAG